jgi:hypothetical protein
MFSSRLGRRVALSGLVLLAFSALATSSAWGASTIYLCLSEKAGAAKSGGVEGKCPAPTKTVTYARVALPKEEAEQQKLLAILPHIKYVEAGVGGKPTIQFSGVNVQVVSGAGKTNAAVNGAGNLVIGYDENPGGRAQTGSHDLILGEEQTFTSFGGIVAGRLNQINGAYASVTGGFENVANGEEASVSGGGENTVSGRAASISGGLRSTASGAQASVSGGLLNAASGDQSAVSGGDFGKASGQDTLVFGGLDGEAHEFFEACGGSPTVVC